MDPATLPMTMRHGSYAGRRVDYFRVFDPVRAAERRIDVRGFGDLDPHADLMLGSGHIEQHGSVVLTRRDAAPSIPILARERADRALHGDDEHQVFPASPEIHS
jgi:hypothetical protein